MKCGSVYTIMEACTVLKVVLTVSFFLFFLKKNTFIYLFGCVVACGPPASGEQSSSRWPTGDVLAYRFLLVARHSFRREFCVAYLYFFSKATLVRTSSEGVRADGPW